MHRHLLWICHKREWVVVCWFQFYIYVYYKCVLWTGGVKCCKNIFYNLVDLYIRFCTLLVSSAQQDVFALTKNTIWDPNWVPNTKLWAIETFYQLRHIKPTWYQIKAYYLIFQDCMGSVGVKPGFGDVCKKLAYIELLHTKSIQ